MIIIELIAIIIVFRYIYDWKKYRILKAENEQLEKDIEELEEDNDWIRDNLERMRKIYFGSYVISAAEKLEYEALKTARAKSK